MRLAALPSFLFLLAFASPEASAIVTLGLSSQNFGLTGIGPNASGQGQSLMSWGACGYDGTRTTCTLSGPFTGLGSGGTYSLTVSYPGNGKFPLNAVSQTPGSDLFYAQATSDYSFVLTLAETGGPTLNFYSFANFSIFFSSPTCTGVAPSACSVGQVGLTPNSTIVGPVTGSFDPTPHIQDSGLVSAGNYGGFPAIAPGTWVEIYGVNLATTQGQIWAGSDFIGNQAPTALGGTTVTIAGLPAYIDYVSPRQVNVQVPSGVPVGPQPVVVTTGGGSSTAYTATVNAVEPGLLAPAAFIINGNQNVVALFSNTLTYVLPNTVPGVRTARAKPGDLITLYGIGFGPVTPDIPAGQIVTQTNQLQNSLRITFAGVPATVTYAGLTPGYVGLYQFNVVVPAIGPSDSVPVAFTLGNTNGPQNLFIAISQ